MLCLQEHVKSSIFCTSKSGTNHRYAYVANVCVTKYARRQGIASNMLQLAIEIAEISGRFLDYVMWFLSKSGTNANVTFHFYRSKGCIYAH